MSLLFLACPWELYVFLTDLTDLENMADTTTDEQSNRPIDGESHPTMQETEPSNIPRYTLVKDV